MQERVNAFGQFAIDATHGAQFLDARGHHARVSTERLQQRCATRRADAGHVFQHAALARLLATLAMASDRETMCFVAYRVDQMQRRRIRTGFQFASAVAQHQGFLTFAP